MLFTITLSLFVVMLGVGIISPILPIFARDLGASGIWIGLIFSTFSISRFIFLPIFGYLADRYGVRKIIISGLLLYSILALLYIHARTPEELTIVRLFHGLSSAMVVPIAMAVIAYLSPKGEEGKYMGIANRSIFLGLAFGPFIGGFVTDIFNISYTFLAMSLLSLLSLLITVLTFPEIKIEINTEASEKKEKISREIIGALIYRVLNSVGRGSVMSFLPIYASLIGITFSEIGILIFINLFISGIIQPKTGEFADKRGVILPVILGNFMSALIFYLIPTTNSFVTLSILLSLLGIFSALSLPAVSSVIAIESKDSGRAGSYMGLFSASKSLGRAIGPLIAGILYDIGGGGLNGIYYAFVSASILSLVAGIIFYLAVGELNSDEIT